MSGSVARIIREHPARSAIAAIAATLMFMLPLTPFARPSSGFGIVITLAFGLLFIGSSLFPRTCPALIAAIACPLLPVSGVYPFADIAVPATLIAIGMFSYHEPRSWNEWLLAAELLGNTGGRLIGNFSNPHDVLSAIVTLDALLIGAYATGSGLRWRDAASAMERMKLERNNRLQRNRIAQQLHDETTGELTYLILRARQQACSTPNDPAMQRLCGDIAVHAQTALTNIHNVIETLDPTSEPTGTTNYEAVIPFPDRLIRLVKHWDDSLAAAGFTGCADFHGNIPDHMDCEQDVLIIVSELYANIMRHCDPRDRNYVMTLTWSDDGLTIVEINAAGGTTIGGDSGRGLAYIRSIVRRRHGSINVIAEDGSWMLQMHLPHATAQ